MMKIHIVCIGKNKGRYTEEAIADFLKKIQPLSSIGISYVKDATGSMDEQKIRDIEADSLMRSLSGSNVTVLLDVEGKRLDTLAAAEWLKEVRDFKGGSVTFVIGGAYGVSDTVRDRVDDIWSLSDFTFSHQLARVVLLEQVYRMLTLINGIPYHK
jgi:23S rRNA (pseudouridine1915-N3)-methyltransferase